ncbi:hypothetical protein OD214_001879 [Salmonella enterica]|nr:hypothetical protein [Salmonella enterica]EJX3292106.1 hypothetical protein [Salmonella enterica]EJX3308030.1 hypothetical protein [Salmonella enterica]
MIKFNSSQSLELDKYQINLNSVDYTELLATSIRALFLHARVGFYDGQKLDHPALSSRARVLLIWLATMQTPPPLASRARVLLSK